MTNDNTSRLESLAVQIAANRLAALERFLDTVEECRKHQRAYFKTKDATALRAAKEAERKVDATIRRLRTPGLFDEGNP